MRNDCLNVFRIAACFLSAAAIAACSGHQPSVPFLPLTADHHAPVSKKAKKPSDTASLTVNGQVVALISGGFTISAGKHCGYLHVYTNGAHLTGLAPAKGLYALATGSGSCATSLAATEVATSTSPITSSPSPSSSPSASPSSSPTSTPISSPVASASPAPTGAPIPTQNAKVTATGTIIGVFSGGFTINTGPTYGYMHVYTNASTVFAGGSPKVGLYAQSTGTGSMSTSVTAGFVALYASAPGSVTISGTALASTPYGFSVSAGNGYSSIPVVMNALTVIGGASLAAGSIVKISGRGASPESILAASIVVATPTPPPGVPATPTPGPISQKHVLTEDYLGAPFGTTSVAWAAAAPYLTWAQTGYASATAIAATGIKTQFYVDPNRTSPNVGDPLYTSNETTFAHDCNGNRVSDQYDNVTQYVMDIGGSSMQTAFTNYVNYMKGLAHFDAVFEDDAGPPMANSYATFSGTPCGYSNSQWLTFGQHLDQLSSIPVIFNGLEIYNGEAPSLSMALLQSSNTIGGSLEHCYSDDSQTKMGGWVWQVTENTELQVGSENKLFLCILRNLNSAATQTDARLYALASFLLTYNPYNSVLWEQFATPSGLHVEPESQLVPLNPVGGTPASVGALVQTGGTYGRQYAQCYLAGKFVGPCAVVVNSTSSPQPFPFPQYAHTLVLSGGGVLDGGTVTTSGPAPPASLGGLEAAIVFP